MLKDPQFFLANLAKCDEAGRRRLWAHAFVMQDFVVTEPVVQSGLEAVEKWGRETHHDEDRFWRNAIHGAFRVLRRATEQGREYDELIPPRLIRLFGCENVWVAGISLRYFEWFPRFQDHCVTRLVEMASQDRRRPASAPYTLGGVAFVVLWALRPELARLSKIRPARQECITGHLELARQISDSPNCQDSYERYCLIANELMWL